MCPSQVCASSCGARFPVAAETLGCGTGRANDKISYIIYHIPCDAVCSHESLHIRSVQLPCSLDCIGLHVGACRLQVKFSSKSDGHASHHCSTMNVEFGSSGKGHASKSSARPLPSIRLLTAALQLVHGMCCIVCQIVAATAIAKWSWSCLSCWFSTSSFTSPPTPQ